MQVKIVLLFAIMLKITIVFGQENGYTITGNVKQSNGTPLTYASVSIRGNLQSSSSTMQDTFTDENGIFVFTNIPLGDYFLSLRSMGFADFERSISVTSDLSLDTLIAYEDDKALEVITVTAKKQVLERKPDRFVMNLANSSFQASNVMDIFQTLPFMQVQGDQFSINGKRNILVLLDNVPMPGVSLPQMLNSLSGNEIDRIEFITTPGPRYDAGVDAVILIHTKKGQKEGWTGSALVNYSQGEYDRGAIGGNLTYRKGKWALGAKYNYRIVNYYVEFDQVRSFTLPDQQLSITDDGYQLYKNRMNNGAIDLQYAPSPNHTFQMQWQINARKAPNSRSETRGTFSSLIDGPVDSTYALMQNINLDDLTQNFSFNYQGKLDSLGKSVEVIATYTPIDNLSVSEMVYQDVYTSTGDFLNRLPIRRNDNPISASILVLQNDWKLPYSSNLLMEAGVKFNRTRNNTDTYQFLRNEDVWEAIPDLTFNNQLYEYIAAMYASAQKTIGNTLLRVALRAEHTQMGVRDEYERNFTDLFPNLMMQQNIGKRKVTLNYRRSISRPGFNQMANWRVYINDFYVEEGSLNLRPAYSNHFTLNGNIVPNLFMEVGYDRRKDQVMFLPRQEGSITIGSPTNMDLNETYASLSYDYKVASWWSGNIYGRGFRMDAYAMINGENIVDFGYSYHIGLSGNFKLPHQFSLTANYNYYAPAQYAASSTESLNFARIALQKTFLERRLTMTLAAEDIFRGQLYRNDFQAGNLVKRGGIYYDSQRVSLGVVFNFGKTSVSKVESRKLGNEDLINRSGS